MAGADSPLTSQQQQELHEANDRAAHFLGAAKVAAFNGWTIGFFAAVSILSGLFSLTGFLVGLGLAVVARNELVGRRRLRTFDPSGLELLWRNQLGLMALVIVYCLWNMVRPLALPDLLMQDLTQLLGPGAGDLVRTLTLTVYATVIVVTAIFQGYNARYYYVRVERIRLYVRETPQWLLDLQRSMAL